MTREEAKIVFLNRGFIEAENCRGRFFHLDKWREACVVISEWLNQEPCEDAVSRAAVLDLCDSKDAEYKVKHFKEDVECLPSVYPKLKIGHWIEHPHEAGPNWEYSKYECSECHEWEDYDSCFCPECGVKMEAEE